MRFESKLCHITENKAIVSVTGWVNDKNLGTSLAEGSTVEDAEDKAILRLSERLNSKTHHDKFIKTINEEQITNISGIKYHKSKKEENVNMSEEPKDWSNELAAIDSEIKRLKWTRDDELNYLKKALGYNNRTKITNYNDIINYLNLLKNIDVIDATSINKKNINELIEQSDNLLRDLSWDHKKGREYLQKEFNVSTRKELNEKQLISFVNKLRKILTR